jgi:threonine synthase
MLSPLDRMSEFQRRQMYTLSDKNIFNIAIRGTFDDCQDIVKAVNEDADFKKKYKLGAVNSINWARIAAQVVYYFWGYFRTTGSDDERVSFSVPTGNFGNILAGYIAKRMDLPIRRLVLATNENNVLGEFFRTGTYRPRKGGDVHATSSPSMDISKASNFERYIFDIVERDAARMEELWQSLGKKGSFTLSREEFQRTTASGFFAGSSDHRARIATIRSIYERYGVLIDPHTADGVTTGLAYREEGEPLVCLETAQPAKFPSTIRESVGREIAIPESFRALSSLPERFEVLEADLKQVQSFVAAHA